VNRRRRPGDAMWSDRGSGKKTPIGVDSLAFLARNESLRPPHGIRYLDMSVVECSHHYNRLEFGRHSGNGARDPEGPKTDRLQILHVRDAAVRIWPAASKIQSREVTIRAEAAHPWGANSEGYVPVQELAWVLRARIQRFTRH
jgi:hypothetical protein